jgi:acetyltransferase-like isoleucine patch superfamily enzyme
MFENIFFLFISPKAIERRLNEFRISENKKLVSLQKSASLYEQCQINNFQNDKTKIQIGFNTHVRGNLQVFAYGGSISIGEHCYVGENSYIWSGDKIIIGNHVLISHSVNIVDTNSHEIDFVERSEGYKHILSKGHPKNKGSISTSPIVIEDYAWISFGSIILKGVRVGKGAIVAAGSVVTKDVKEFTLVAGNPAKEIKNLR